MTRSRFRAATGGVALLLVALGVVLLGPASFGPNAIGAAGFTVNSTADANDVSGDFIVNSTADANDALQGNGAVPTQLLLRERLQA